MKIFAYLGLASARMIHFNAEKWQAAGETHLQPTKSPDSLIFVEKSRKIGREKLKNIQKMRKTAKTRSIAFNPSGCSYKDIRNQLLGGSEQAAACNGWKFDKYAHTYVTFHQTKY